MAFFLDKIKKRIIPQSLIDKKETDRHEFDVLGALLTALKGMIIISCIKVCRYIGLRKY